MLTIPLWMRTIDAKILAIAFCDWADSQQMRPNLDDIDKDILNRAKRYSPIFRESLKISRPFGWGADSIQAVIEASASIPNETVLNRHNLEDKVFFWWFEHPLYTSIGNTQALVGSWMTLEGQSIFNITLWYQIEVNGVIRFVPGPVWDWKENETVLNLLNRTDIAKNRSEERRQQGHDTVGQVSKFLLAAFAWLGQRILTVTEEHGERHARKRYQKIVKHWHPVSVVHLRKREYHSDGPVDSQLHSSSSYRFVVGGHWRNQACGPAHSDRKLIYIMPFIKGPEAAPFRPKIKVYEVTR
jgi:hypothetical protein